MIAPPSRRPGPRGVGFLTGVVVLLLLVMLVIQLHQAFLSETVFDEAQGGHVGAVALTLAESVLEESILAVRATANDPKSAPFLQFREKMQVDPAPGFEIRGLAGVGDRTRALLTEQVYRPFGFTVEARSPRVLFRKLFDVGLNSYNEHCGTIAYRAHARASRDRTVVERSVEATQEFKIVAAGLLPPFDQVPLAIVDPEPIVGGSEANLTAEYFAKVKKYWLDRFTRLQGQGVSGDQAATAREIKGEFEKVPDYVATAGPAADPAVHAFKFPMVAFALPSACGLEGGLGSDLVDLASRLPSWRAEVERLDKESNEAMNALEQSASSGQPSNDSVERVKRVLKELAKALGQHQQSIKKWQQAFGMVTDAGAIGGLLQDAQRFGAGSVPRRAFQRIDEKSVGGNATEAFIRFLGDVKRRTGFESVNGIVWVDNPGSVLDLTGRSIGGRVTIAASGAVRVGDTGARAPGDALAVIACGTLTLKGGFTGSLAAMGAISVEEPSAVTGSLLLARPAPGGLANLTVKCDPQLSGMQTAQGQSGYRGTSYYVGLAPRLSSKRIDRKAGG